MNNLKFDEILARSYNDLVADIYFTGMRTQQRFSGAMRQRELVKLVLDSRIQLSASNNILFDGSLFDLAVEYLRDLPKVSPDEKQIPSDPEH